MAGEGVPALLVGTISQTWVRLNHHVLEPNPMTRLHIGRPPLTMYVRTNIVQFMNPNHDSALGGRLRALRKECGETLREVAASAGIDPALLSKIERASRLPTAEQVTSLSNHFGIAEDNLQAQRIAVDFISRYGEQQYVRLAIPIISQAFSRSGRGPTGSRNAEQ